MRLNAAMDFGVCAALNIDDGTDGFFCAQICMSASSLEELDRVMPGDFATAVGGAVMGSREVH